MQVKFGKRPGENTNTSTMPAAVPLGGIAYDDISGVISGGRNGLVTVGGPIRAVACRLMDVGVSSGLA